MRYLYSDSLRQKDILWNSFIVKIDGDCQLEK